MKKFFIFFLLLAMVFTFVSCNDEPASGDSGSDVKDFDATRDGAVLTQMYLDGQEDIEDLIDRFNSLPDEFSPSRINSMEGSIAFNANDSIPTSFKMEYEYFKEISEGVYETELSKVEVEVTMSDFTMTVDNTLNMTGSIKVGFSVDMEGGISIPVGTEYTYTSVAFGEMATIAKAGIELEPYDDEENDRPYGLTGKAFNDAMLAGFEYEVVEEACQRSLLQSKATFNQVGIDYDGKIYISLDGDAALNIDIVSISLFGGGTTDLTISLLSDNLKVWVGLGDYAFSWEFEDFSVVFDIAPKTVEGKSKYSEFDIDVSIGSLRITGEYGDEIDLVAELKVDEFAMEQGKYTNAKDERVLDKGIVKLDSTASLSVTVGENSAEIKAGVKEDISDLDEFQAFDLGDAIEEDLTLISGRVNSTLVKPDQMLDFILKAFVMMEE